MTALQTDEGPRSLRMTACTADAYRLPMASLFVRALRDRAAVDAARAADVELALHEAVVNAVTHGNLGVGSTARASAEGFERFCRDIAERLNEQAFSRRSVTVTARWSVRQLLIAVVDEGEGFDLAAIGGLDTSPAERVLAATPHGRGIRLMRAMANGVRWEQSRRRLLLSFRRDGSPA